MSAPLPRPSLCRSCRASIRFAVGVKGAPMPVDAEPSPTGNVLLAYVDGAWTASVLTPGQAAGARDAGQPTYTSHFAGCPDADTHRKRAQQRAIKHRSKR